MSIDSFDPDEVRRRREAGAELVLERRRHQSRAGRDWGAEVVAIPDRPGSLDGLDQTIAFLDRRGVPFRIDPILEPIGFGFAASLGRYLEVQRRYPDADVMMGVGNLTELTDVDSAGVNTLLIGFCQELGVRSVLTTAVINWARSSVREIDLARRLAHHSVSRGHCPSTSSRALSCSATRKSPSSARGESRRAERRINDPNWRIFAEEGYRSTLSITDICCATQTLFSSSHAWMSRTHRMPSTSVTN